MEEVEDNSKNNIFLSFYIVIRKQVYNFISLIKTTCNTTMCVYIVTKLYYILVQFLNME